MVDHRDAVGHSHWRAHAIGSAPVTRLAAVSSPRRNVELKATDPDPEHSLATVRDLGAEDRGTLVQRDTFFRVAEE